MNDLKVSIIVPVFNAVNFVIQAVESALAQPESAEVILIEDGSYDGSLQVCQKLTEKYEKVRLLQHPGGVNKGAGASRNLGMQNAKFDYIAFLDADDFYLPSRFAVAKEIFIQTPDCDGVYEALGIYFENEDARSKWLESDMKHVNITTMTKEVKPEGLFENLIKGGSGYFSLDALVFKKSLVNNTGYMNEDLRLHQDTDFIFKLAAVGKLLPGRLNEPVAMRRVHGDNRISKPRSDSKIYQDRMKMWKSTYLWLHQAKLREKRLSILNQILSFAKNSKPLPVKWMSKLPKEFQQLIRLFLLIFEFPSVVITKAYWNYLFSIKLLPVFKRNIQKFIQ